MQTENLAPDHVIASSGPSGFNDGPYTSPILLTMYSPNYTGSNIIYNRLGTLSEVFMLTLNYSISVTGDPGAFGSGGLASGSSVLTLQYRYYPSGSWKSITTLGNSASGYGSSNSSMTQVFVTRSTAWNQLKFRVYVTGSSAVPTNWDYGTTTLTRLNISVSCPNFGTGDAQITTVNVNTPLESLPAYPRLP
jgi:hypothetical protein